MNSPREKLDAIKAKAASNKNTIIQYEVDAFRRALEVAETDFFNYVETEEKNASIKDVTGDGVEVWFGRGPDSIVINHHSKTETTSHLYPIWQEFISRMKQAGFTITPAFSEYFTVS